MQILPKMAEDRITSLGDQTCLVICDPSTFRQNFGRYSSDFFRHFPISPKNHFKGDQSK